MWTFLALLYPFYEVADGEAEADEDNCAPRSNLYSFILNHYNVPLLSVVPEKLPPLYEFLTEEMVYREDEHESCWRSELPYDYDDEYGEPEVVGHIYEFRWDEMYGDRETHRQLVEALEKPDSPFMSEYEAIKRLLSDLASKAGRERTTRNIFDKMS